MLELPIRVLNCMELIIMNDYNYYCYQNVKYFADSVNYSSLSVLQLTALPIGFLTVVNPITYRPRLMCENLINN